MGESSSASSSGAAAAKLGIGEKEKMRRRVDKGNPRQLQVLVTNSRSLPQLNFEGVGITIVHGTNKIRICDPSAFPATIGFLKFSIEPTRREQISVLLFLIISLRTL